MSKSPIAVMSHIVKIADPEALTTRIQYTKLSDPEEGDVDQRSVYQVSVYLNEES